MHRRAEERTPTLVEAQIIGGGRTIACVIKDVSAKGARLRVSDATLVPPQFELLIKNGGAARPAKVRWRRKAEIGVSFMPERRAFGRRLVPPEPAAGG